MVTNYNILRFTKRVNDKHHLQWFARGKIFPVPVLVNQIPPFQHVRERTNNPITEFVLINKETGIETDILSEVTTAGLEVRQPTGKDYDLIVYPSSVPIVTATTFDIGLYYVRMKDVVNTWESEFFNMCDTVDDLVKIEWCHSSNLDYPGGHYDYSNNFKHYYYLNSDVARPRWEYEIDASKRKSRNFPITKIRFKLHRIGPFLLPEYIADFLSMIPLHDHVKVYYWGQEYIVEEFIFTPDEWQEPGSLVETEIEFRTDKVTVVTQGRGELGGSCDPDVSSCLTIDYPVVARIVENSDEYNGDYYINKFGVQVMFSPGDYVLVDTSNGTELFLYSGTSSYNLVAGTLYGEYCYIEDTETWYYRNLTTAVWFTTIMTYVVNGSVWEISFGSIPGTSAEFYTVTEEGIETLIGIESVDLLNLPFEVEINPSIVAIKMKVYNVTCGAFQEYTLYIDPALVALTTVDLTALTTNSGVALVSSPNS